MHLFDHTVKPVLLYGSEIWGTINTASAKVKKDSFSLFNTMYGMPCEKLHIRFLKYLSAVNRKTTNAVIMGELGRFPVMIDVLCNTIKYFQSLFSDCASNLLTGALKESCHLHESKKKSWISTIYFLLKYLNVESRSSSANLINIVKSKLIAKYIRK